jgi:signal transduction histidine kinase
MKKLQKQKNYKEAYRVYNIEYILQSKKMTEAFDTIIDELNSIDNSNQNIRNELNKILPPSLKIMQDGLRPYQKYLNNQKNSITKIVDENSKILDTISIILTILNIFIIIIVAYWIRYQLVEQIRYLKDRYKDLQETQSQLIESEKMASLGGMVAGVAHEINTPVGMALTAVTHLEEETKKLKKMYDTQDMSEEDFENYLEDSLKLNQSIYINLDKAASLVRSFKQVAVDQTSNHDRKFNFEEYTQEILQSLHSQLKKLQIKIELAIDKDLEIHSNPGAFSQILSNFIMNSITHGLSSAHEGLIRIEAIRDEENFILKYSDNGKGMDKKTQEKIFDPFFTTNRENGGSGLGMNIIFNLVTQKLHGKIELETGVNQGVLFTIRAPLHYKSKDIKEVSPL